MLQFSRQVKAWALAGQGTEELEHGPVFAKEEEKMKRQKLARLQNLATALNYPLTPPAVTYASSFLEGRVVTVLTLLVDETNRKL